MISHEHKCIFIHQRKCAGNTIIQAFHIESPEDERWHFMNDGILSSEYHQAPSDYFRFTVVRNPWDRFVSGWLYCDGTRDRSMRDLLRYMPTLGHDYIHIARLQRDILFNHEGFLIVGKLVRFERLQADFDDVCDIINKPKVILPRTNVVANRRPYQEYFEDPIDRDLFLRHFARDVDTFEYEF